MITLTLEEAKEWPTRRWQIVRQVALAALWKGPLLGLIVAVLLLAGAAGLSYLCEGQTLEFGWFRIPGAADAPVYPIPRRFWVFARLTVPVFTAFLALVGIAAVVTLELHYRRRNAITKRGDS